MIILYVKLCKDVSNIKENLKKEATDKSISQVSLKDIKLAVLTNKQEEIYEKVVSTTYKYLYKICYIDKSGNVQIKDNNSKMEIDRTIYRSITFCRKLGKELPKELTSTENFIQFFNEK